MMDAAVAQPRILLVSTSDSDDSPVVSRFLDTAEVRVVGSFDDALAALHETSYDLVVSTTSDFAVLKQAAVI